MRKISKNKEPNAWLQYRLTSDATYQSTPELRQSLLEEQGYLCAYCMRRIPGKDSNSNEDSRIDHILSRSNNPDLSLSYSNMVICCPGAINSNFHCDKSKGENNISFDLFDDNFINTISYKTRTGEITCSNPTHNDEINKVLNLNHPLLMSNRLHVIKGIKISLTQKKWTKNELTKQLKKWASKNTHGQFYPYAGIVIWYLTQKLENNYPH